MNPGDHIEFIDKDGRRLAGPIEIVRLPWIKIRGNDKTYLHHEINIINTTPNRVIHE